MGSTRPSKGEVMPQPLKDEDGATLLMSFKSRTEAEEFYKKQEFGPTSEIRDYGVKPNHSSPSGWEKVEGGASIWNKK